MNVRLQALLFKILFVIASMCAQIIQHQIMIAFSASDNVIERGNAKSKAADAAKPWQDEINALGKAVQELLEAEAARLAIDDGISKAQQDAGQWSPR